MRFGIVVTDDHLLWGGEKGVGEYFVSRFEERNVPHDHFIPIHAVTGQLPNQEDIITFDGFIFTGSHYSVNDDRKWIRNLEVFIRQVYNISVEFGKPKMFGICFGHQLIAKALGGIVGPNPDKAFNFGSTDVQVKEEFFAREFNENLTFKKQRKSTITLMKFHGECVLEVPKMATVIGSSEQCKHEILLYGNSVLTTQGHPEYTKKAMTDTNSKIMSHIGRLQPEDIKKNLNTINEADVDSCTDMVYSFLHHHFTEISRKNKFY